MTGNVHSGGDRRAARRTAHGYAEESRASVFALAEPDATPLPNITRAALVWIGTHWIEIDQATGEIVATGGEE